MDKLELSYRSFCDSNDDRRWIKGVGIVVYVRRTVRHFDGRSHKVLDIANVTVHPDYQRQGIFTRFLEMVEKDKKFDGIYIEQCRPELEEMFRRRQYRMTGRDLGGTASFYKPRVAHDLVSEAIE